MPLNSHKALKLQCISNRSYSGVVKSVNQADTMIRPRRLAFATTGNYTSCQMRLRTVTKPLLFAGLAVLLAVSVALAASATLFVTVKQASIRKDRQFYATTVATAVFRDRLTVLAREKDWVRVRFNGVEGWIHISATATKAVTITAKDATSGISQDDVALSSKGFDASVEREYRKGATRADFADVDRMEQLAVSEKTLSDFRKAGNLRARGDGR